MCWETYNRCYPDGIRMLLLMHAVLKVLRYSGWTAIELVMVSAAAVPRLHQALCKQAGEHDPCPGLF